MTIQRTFEETLRAFQHRSGKGSRQRGIPQTHHRQRPQPPKPWPAFLSFAELMQPLPPPEWEVEPLFCQGDRVLVFGRSTARKSWLLMHMGICLAAGQPWLGKFGISKPRKVLYIDKEMGERRTRWRSEQLARGMGLNQHDLPFQALVHPPFVADVEGPERLLATFAERDWQPDVIIIEGLRRILVGDENNSQDVAACWANLNPITEAGITLIMTHHMVKGVGSRKNSGFDLIRGSGDLLAGVDIGLSVFRDFGGGPTTVIQDKARDGEEHAPFDVNVNFGPGRTDPVTLHFAGENPEMSTNRTQQAAALVLEYLKGQPEQKAKRGDIDTALEKQGIPRRTVTRAIELLDEGGAIISPKRGYWQIAAEMEDNISSAA